MPYKSLTAWRCDLVTVSSDSFSFLNENSILCFIQLHLYHTNHKPYYYETIHHKWLKRIKSKQFILHYITTPVRGQPHTCVPRVPRLAQANILWILCLLICQCLAAISGDFWNCTASVFTEWWWRGESNKWKDTHRHWQLSRPHLGTYTSMLHTLNQATQILGHKGMTKYKQNYCLTANNHDYRCSSAHCTYQKIICTVRWTEPINYS